MPKGRDPKTELIKIDNVYVTADVSHSEEEREAFIAAMRETITNDKVLQGRMAAAAAAKARWDAKVEARRQEHEAREYERLRQKFENGNQGVK